MKTIRLLWGSSEGRSLLITVGVAVGTYPLIVAMVATKVRWEIAAVLAVLIPVVCVGGVVMGFRREGETRRGSE